MKFPVYIFVFAIGLCSVSAQISNATEVFELPSTLSESSGAIFFNNKLITHNDSGGEAKLFELDTLSGVVTRTVTITNAVNVDWEDMTQDANHIYIGDIGNNSGSRTDLKIYKVSKSDYVGSTTVTAETIAFSYSAQTDFTATPNASEWDAEALVSFDASNLMLFSKNWVDGVTKAYVVPKSAGTYSVSPLATTLNSGGLISGGTYNPFSHKLYLVGYSSILQPFVWVSENFSGTTDIFDGTNTKTGVSSFPVEQIEAITFVDVSRYFMTSESFSFGTFSENAKLISFSTSDTLSAELVPAEAVFVYPNPVDSFLYVSNKEVEFIELCDLNTRQLYKGISPRVDMRSFANGVYVVKVTLKNGRIALKKVVKK